MMNATHGEAGIALWRARLAGVPDCAKLVFSVVNPSTGLVVAHVSSCGRQEAMLAVEGASYAYSAWSRTDGTYRSHLLDKWRRLISDNIDHLATTVTSETGKPIREARTEIVDALEVIGQCADVAKLSDFSTVVSHSRSQQVHSRARPIGTVVAVTNWCQPALTVARKTALALASGCPVILKPSSRAPLTGIILAELWTEAGGPMGTFQVVPTDDPITVVDTFLSDTRVDMVTFTGSADVGQYLARQCAEACKPFVQEINGQRPFIVFADADLERATEAIIACTFLRNAGQDCTSASRLYVQDAIAERLLGILTKKVAALRCGDPLAPDTQMGPLVDGMMLTVMAEQIADALEGDAQLVIGGRRKDGLQFAPTILDRVRPEMRVATEELSGPILPVLRFSETEEVLELAMSTTKGANAWLWTSDFVKAERVARDLGYSNVWINDVGRGSKNQIMPWAGRMPVWPPAELAPYVKAVQFTVML